MLAKRRGREPQPRVGITGDGRPRRMSSCRQGFVSSLCAIGRTDRDLPKRTIIDQRSLTSLRHPSPRGEASPLFATFATLRHSIWLTAAGPFLSGSGGSGRADAPGGVPVRWVPAAGRSCRPPRLWGSCGHHVRAPVTRRSTPAAGRRGAPSGGGGWPDRPRFERGWSWASVKFGVLRLRAAVEVGETDSV